jgi:malate synthase
MEQRDIVLTRVGHSLRAIAMQGITNDKKRDAVDGHDGGWVAPRLGRGLDEGVPRGAGRQARPVGKAAPRRQRRHPLARRLAGRQRLRAHPQPDRAAKIFKKMSTDEEFAEFLTLPLYEESTF